MWGLRPPFCSNPPSALYMKPMLKSVSLALFFFCSSPRWRFPKERQTNCCCCLFHTLLIPCSFSPAPRSIALLLGCYLSGGQCYAPRAVQSALVIWGELRQTLIGGTGVCAPYPLWAHTTRRCGNPIIPPIRNLLWQGQQHRAPGYHLSSQQIGSCNTRQTDGSSSCWGPGWSKAVASCLHDWRPEKWRGGLVIKERRGGGGDGGGGHF